VTIKTRPVTRSTNGSYVARRHRSASAAETSPAVGSWSSTHKHDRPLCFDRKPISRDSRRPAAAVTATAVRGLIPATVGGRQKGRNGLHGRRCQNPREALLSVSVAIGRQQRAVNIFLRYTTDSAVEHQEAAERSTDVGRERAAVDARRCVDRPVVADDDDDDGRSSRGNDATTDTRLSRRPTADIVELLPPRSLLGGCIRRLGNLGPATLKLG